MAQTADDGAGLRMIAEWAPHARCLMAWPGREPTTTLAEALKPEIAAIARAVSPFEPVLMLARPGLGREAAAACGSGVEVAELELADAWIRDSGPLFARRGDELVAVDFRFNGWGERIPADDHDRATGAALARRLGLARVVAPYVLEGGAVTTDGEGTLIAVETSVLTGNRNPGARRAELEGAFRELLGIERTIWLRHGLAEDRTDGHADNAVRFLAPGRVLCQTVADPDDPNFERLADNRRTLAAAVDARGRALEVVDFELLPYVVTRRRRLAFPYLNCYLGNGCVVVPVTGDPADRAALARLGELFPGREVVGVPGAALGVAGGGVHCVTLEQPLAGGKARAAGS